MIKNRMFMAPMDTGFGDTGYADASRAAVEDMLKDIRENI